MSQELRSVVMENVKIIFLNFAGKEGMYNREGDRSFCVLLDHETAQAMADDGWNVKMTRDRTDDGGDPGEPYLPVAVNFGKGRPPKVVMVTSRGRTTLHEGEVELLDWAEIKHVDLIVNPYTWDVNGKSGVKAYLKSIFVTVEEDELDLKYADVPDADAPSDHHNE
jgi:hypothetical protein